MNYLDTNLYERQGKAVTNFSKTLPAPQSNLAQEITRDPYQFDFLAIRKDHDEKELKDAIMNNVSAFLMELGTGFALMGREYRLKVGETEQWIDLLFYHAKLHCYVVIEVKATNFKPEYVGQLGTYMVAVNHILKTDSDEPTIDFSCARTKTMLLPNTHSKAQASPSASPNTSCPSSSPKTSRAPCPPSRKSRRACEMNNYKWIPLGEVCEFENGDRGKNYPSKNEFQKYGIPFLNAGNIDQNRLCESGFDYITKEKYDSLRSGKAHQGDILFCLRGRGCGRFSGRPRRPAPAASCGRLSYRTPCALPRRTPSASPPGTSGSTRRARRRTARRRPRASPSRGRTRP